MKRLSRDSAWLAAVSGLCVLFALFFLLPLAGLIDRGVRDGDVWPVATSAAARKAIILSLWTSTVATLVAITFGTPLAYVLSRSRFRGKTIIDALIDLPIVLPPTVAGVALLTAFGRKGLIGEPIESLTGFTFGFRTTAVIMAQVLVAAPFYVRAARAGFQAVDPQLVSVAYTLGASRSRTFFRIVAPLARPSLVAGVALCWSRAMGELGATLIFAGSLEGSTRTMPLAILNSFEGRDGLSGAVALSLVLLSVAMAALLLLWIPGKADRQP
jgi:molybdate transport system permease protein